MAHVANIPIAYSYLCTRRKWELCDFTKGERPQPVSYGVPTLSAPTPSGFATPLGSIASSRRPDVLIRIHRPGIRGMLEPPKTFRVYGEEVTRYLEIALELRNEGTEVPESLSQVLFGPPAPEEKEREMNPWVMREEFLRLEETNVALLEFINRWGVWGDYGFLYDIENTRLLAKTLAKLSDPSPEMVLPYVVWKHRKELREGMLGKADAWLSNKASLALTQRRSTYPYLGITDRTCSTAIATTITLDHMRQTKWRICKRPDCSNIFVVESDHGKVYCEQYCAHLVSVRRKRAAAKRANKTTKRRKA